MLGYFAVGFNLFAIILLIISLIFRREKPIEEIKDEIDLYKRIIKYIKKVHGFTDL